MVKKDFIHTLHSNILESLLPYYQSEKPLDISISYPRYINSLHKPLSAFAREVREKAIGIEIDRDEQIRRIARFYGFTEGTIVAVPSAGEALHTLLQYFTDKGDQILIPEGSYARFPNFVESLAGGERVARWVDVDELSEWVNYSEGNMNQAVVLLEEPRSPAFATPDSDVYLLTSIPGKFRAVIYDGVNWGFDNNTNVLREGQENRLRRSDSFPTSETRMKVMSTSKILPTEGVSDAFPNVGIIAVSGSVDPKALEQLIKGIPRKHYASPSNADLYIMAEILHSHLFPKFIQDIRDLAKRNTEYVRDNTVAQLIPDGANVFVGFRLPISGSIPSQVGKQLKALGLNALYSQLYFRREKVSNHTLIRVPIIMDQPDLEKTVAQLNKKLTLISKMVTYRESLPFPA